MTFKTIVAEERHAIPWTGAAFLPNFLMTFGTLGRSARRLFNMTDKSRDRRLSAARSSALLAPMRKQRLCSGIISIVRPRKLRTRR